MMTSLVAALFTMTAVRGFDLYPLPKSPVGDSAWELSGYCQRADVPMMRRFIDRTKGLISAARDGRTQRTMVAQSIWATYLPWQSSYALTFDFAHPRDLTWVANCLRVAGADLQEIQRHGLHVRADRAPIDLEYAPDVGFYYVVVETRS
jgi:hypothetical protein